MPVVGININDYIEESLVDENKIIRHVGKNGHPIINADMFEKYAKNRIGAAQTLLLDEHQKGNISDEKMQKKLDQLNDLINKSAFSSTDDSVFTASKAKWVTAHEKLDLAQDGTAYQAALLKCKKADKAFQGAFDEYYNNNIEIMKKLNVQLALIVSPAQNVTKTIKQINEKANDLRAEQARPIQENHYTVGENAVTSSHIPEGFLTHDQKILYEQKQGKTAPEGPYTNPSTIRDERQIGQANALKTEIKIGENPVFTGHRHGSPCVLKINNEVERQTRTLQNVRQIMQLAAQEAYDKLDNKNPNQPLTINIATMSLLSPVAKNDRIGSIKIDGMQQYRQVNDSRHAYWSLQGRETPLQIKNKEGQEITIQVKLDSTFMSMGVNAVRGVGTSEAKKLVQRINNRGIDSFIDNFSKNTLMASSVSDATHVLDKIKGLEANTNIQKYKQAIATFDSSKKTYAYERLEICNEVLRSNQKNKVALKDRKTALRTIEKEEKKLDSLYKKLNRSRQKNYSSPTGINFYKTELDNLRNKPDMKNNADYKVARLFIDALEIYYNQPQPNLKRALKVNKKTKKRKQLVKQLDKLNDPEQKKTILAQADQIQQEIDALNKSNYQFQARFALLSAHMGSFVEWFCKSGEDRTGLLNEQIEAFCIFIHEKGCPPSHGDKADEKRFHEIMKLVHNGAPNRETNGFNDDCPGLKVTDKDFFMPSVSYETDKKIANISKNSIKISKDLLEEVKRDMRKAQQLPERKPNPIANAFRQARSLMHSSRDSKPKASNEVPQDNSPGNRSSIKPK